MAVILILAPSPAERRRLSLEGGHLPGSSFGVLFETALTELVRTLDGPSLIDAVLVPWRRDTRALLAAAAADTAMAFDPEAPSDKTRQSSRLVAYRDPAEGHDTRRDAFWRASHISLAREAPLSLEEAVFRYPPTHLILLGPPSDAGLVRAIAKEHDANIVVFSTLTPLATIAAAIDLPEERITFLEAEYGEPEDDVSKMKGAHLERRMEDELEPFVPFSMLLQKEWDELLFEEERRFE